MKKAQNKKIISQWVINIRRINWVLAPTEAIKTNRKKWHKVCLYVMVLSKPCYNKLIYPCFTTVFLFNFQQRLQPYLISGKFPVSIMVSAIWFPILILYQAIFLVCFLDANVWAESMKRSYKRPELYYHMFKQQEHWHMLQHCIINIVGYFGNSRYKLTVILNALG